MATAHLIHGYLGAGKTTFARRLEAELGAVRYSPNEWMVALFGTDPPAERFAQHFTAIAALIDVQWPKVLRAGVDVILDFGFWTRAERDAARARADALRAQARLYALRCPEPLARRRCQQRNQNLGASLYIAENTFDLLKTRFEPLDHDELFELVDTTQ